MLEKSGDTNLQNFVSLSTFTSVTGMERGTVNVCLDTEETLKITPTLEEPLPVVLM